MFNKIAHRYDLVNDVLSLGLHRYWKRRFVRGIEAPESGRVLDLASGTGDVAFLLAKAHPESEIIAIDPSVKMLEIAEARNQFENISFEVGKAEELPAEDGEFDAATIAFGIRNIHKPSLAIAELYRALKPGANLNILEFALPSNMLVRLFFFQIVFPLSFFLAKFVGVDVNPYKYFRKSIQTSVQGRALLELMQVSGFRGCSEQRLLNGFVRIYRGQKEQSPQE
jgi:demethylmenaquinone methyltransferase/2-methoxy-6-polyprenyl-1,4-benzoquinol methylase